MSGKLNLLTSVAVAALVASASSAFAQDVNISGSIIQNANNQEEVSSTGIINNNGALIGIGAQGSVSSSGALAGVTATTLNQQAPSVTISGSIEQSATNSKTITVDGRITNGNLTGNGSSLGVSASGATAAVGYTSVNNTNTTSPTISVDYIKQEATNSGEVENVSDGSFSTSPPSINPNIEFQDASGHGVSVSASASGATSVVGITVVNDQPGYGPTINVSNSFLDSFDSRTLKASISQTSTNTGHVSNRGVIEGNAIEGRGASVSVSASGATSAIGVTGINSNVPGVIVSGGAIHQTAKNDGASVTNEGGIGLHGNVTGSGASLNVSASGATAAVSFTTISNSNLDPRVNTLQIRQSSFNDGNVSNQGAASSGTEPATIGLGGNFVGDGASISVSASGATSAIGLTGIGGTAPSANIAGTIHQVTTNEGHVSNDGLVRTLGYVDGDGASIGASASGATSAVGFTGINNTTGETPKLNMKWFGQVTTNTGEVSNTATLNIGGKVEGHGASVSASASGAISALGVTSIGGKAPFITFNGQSGFPATITQTTTNEGKVTNSGKIVVGASVAGDGASVGVGASGATSAIGYTSINNSNTGKSPEIKTQGIEQETTNSGAIRNKDASITINGDVSGNGASVSASASGATSAIGVTSIAGNAPSLSVSIKPVTQTTLNDASVRNKGEITVNGNASGHGLSLGVSASGATSAIGYTSVDSKGNATIDTTDIVQGTFKSDGGVNTLGTHNEGKITNRGKITVGGGVIGVGASASISAAGASSVVGITSLNDSSGTQGKAPQTVHIGNITQTTKNSGNGEITNNGTIQVGNLIGSGASLNVSASGATSAVGYTSIYNKNTSTPTINTGTITQHSHNTKSVQNTGTINVASITGAGASASISAAGATSAIGVTRINDNQIASVSTGAIKQTALNTGPVTNQGTINVGAAGVSGTGLSLSVGASGATAVASVSVIKN